ncbi:MAG: maleylacetate reductase [Parvularculales bacterium]
MDGSSTELYNQSVRFGVGVRREVLAEVESLGKQRALVLTTPEQSHLSLEIAEYLGSSAGGVFSSATMHTPVEVTEKALSHVNSTDADCLIAVGGGSTIGLSKALALRTNLPQIAIPTTYAGSEATPILGQTENGVKTTLKDIRVLPETILYDPELVATLPKSMSVNSGLNAMAHAAEGLYAEDRTPETTALALEGLETLIKGLSKVVKTPDDLVARENTQRGAWACGTVLGRLGMSLHHKLCHTLGGSFNLPHAETHAVILPHAIAFNEVAEPDLLKPISTLLEGESAGTALWDFAQSLGAPLSLAELGMKVTELERAADLATQNSYWNPREITPEALIALLQNAQAGTRPGI